MQYVTVELQTADDGSVANLTTVWDTLPKAESAFHTILAAAAQSSLAAHSCTLLDGDGQVMDWRCYRRGGE